LIVIVWLAVAPVVSTPAALMVAYGDVSDQAVLRSGEVPLYKKLLSYRLMWCSY
jgi:hypothetical protein